MELTNLKLILRWYWVGAHYVNQEGGLYYHPAYNTYKENTLRPKMGTRTSGSSISTPILFLSIYLISAPALRTCVKYKSFKSHAHAFQTVILL